MVGLHELLSTYPNMYSYKKCTHLSILTVLYMLHVIHINGDIIYNVLNAFHNFDGDDKITEDVFDRLVCKSER